jgi:hypothetical protein
MIETHITDIVKCDVIYVQICILDQHVAVFMLQLNIFVMFLATVNLFYFLILVHDIAQNGKDLKVVFVGTSASPTIFKIEAFYSRDEP